MILNCRYRLGLYRIIVSNISLKTRCFGLHFCRRKFTFIFNHFGAMRDYAPRSCRVRCNNGKYGPFRRSRSFKVTDFGTNRKHIYDFLLVITTNLPSVFIVPFLGYSIPDVKNRYICLPLAFKLPDGEVPLKRTP